jgi:hypothetical protein
LGQIGVFVFGLVVTDLIQDLYPHLRVGYASVRQCAVIRIGPCLIVTPESARSNKEQKHDRKDVMSLNIS